MNRLIFLLVWGGGLAMFEPLTHYERLNGPVVGILTLPTSMKDQTFAQSSFSMSPGSYVKWLEQSGIRIIPIRYDMPKRVILKMMSMINGILITGGSTSLFHNRSRSCRFKRLLDSSILCPSAYMRTADFIIKNAVKMFDRGKPFPVWGTCLGYEAILISLSKYTLRRKKILSINHSLNLEINREYTPFMEHYFGKDLLENINREPLIYFNHKYAFTPQQVHKNRYLKESIQVLTTTKLENNTVVVSMIKDKKYPIIGVQFHPEKIQFEHRASVETNVSYNSIEASHKMSMMFFDLVNQNPNEIKNEKELEALLIYNYPLYKSSGPYEQIYVFPKAFELKFKTVRDGGKSKLMW